MKWLLIICLLACADQNKSTSNPEPCWADRKTVDLIKNAEGVITIEADWLAITLDSSVQVFPCNLPSEYQDGDSVVFSANQKEIFPNERWAGKPIELTEIEKK